MDNSISQSHITLPLLVTEGMLLTLAVALSFAIQLLEVEDVVDETPVVTAWLTLSIFMLLMLANAQTLASYHEEISKYAQKRDSVLYSSNYNLIQNTVLWSKATFVTGGILKSQSGAS